MAEPDESRGCDLASLSPEERLSGTLTRKSKARARARGVKRLE